MNFGGKVFDGSAPMIDFGRKKSNKRPCNLPLTRIRTYDINYNF